jgi:PPM family protein phosphatase
VVDVGGRFDGVRAKRGANGGASRRAAPRDDGLLAPESLAGAAEVGGYSSRMDERQGRTSLVEYATGTTTGSCREVNEDAFGVFEESNVFVVADGCGGRSFGKSAANLTVASFAHPRPPEEFGLAEADPLALGVLTANARVLREASTGAERRGQGAALCAGRVSPRAVSIVHVGDCRVGRCREGRLDWLTEDHSLLSELRRSGASPEGVARVTELHSTVITRAVGVRDALVVDISYQPASLGDIYLLCTDGLTRSVSRAQINELLCVDEWPLRRRCAALLAASESAGGRDNATVLLLELRS